MEANFFNDGRLLLNIEVLWNMTPCSWLKSYRGFEVPCCLYLESKVTSRRDRKTLRFDTQCSLEKPRKCIFNDKE